MQFNSQNGLRKKFRLFIFTEGVTQIIFIDLFIPSVP